MSTVVPVKKPGKIPASHIWVALGAMIASVGSATTLTGLSFFTNPIVTEYGWSIATFTLYFTIYSLASAFAMPVAAQLLPKLGARVLLGAGGIIAAIGFVLFSRADSLLFFYFAGFVLGAGMGVSALYIPVVLVNRWFVAQRGLVLGLVLAGSGLGGVIVAYVQPQLIYGYGWRFASVVLGIAVLVATVIPAVFMVKSSPLDISAHAYGADAKEASPEELVSLEPGFTHAQAMKSPLLYILFASVVLMGMTHAMSQHVVNYLALRPWGIDVAASTVSTVMMIATIALIIYKPLLGTLVDNIGLRKTLIITLSIAGVATFVSAFVTDRWIYYVCMALIALGLANATVSPPLITEAAFGPKAFSKIWGVMGMALPIGTAIGTPLWGLIKDELGSYGWGFVATPVTTALFLWGFLYVMRKGAEQWDPRLKGRTAVESATADEASA